MFVDMCESDGEFVNVGECIHYNIYMFSLSNTVLSNEVANQNYMLVQNMHSCFKHPNSAVYQR